MRTIIWILFAILLPVKLIMAAQERGQSSTAAEDPFSQDEWTTYTSDSAKQKIIYSKKDNINHAKKPQENQDIKPIMLDEREGGIDEGTNSPTLSSILPSKVNLKSVADKPQKFQTRNVYDYRKAKPIALLRSPQIVARNKHLPASLYHIDYTQMLFAAVNQGNVGALSSLLEGGADINGYYQKAEITPLMIAVQKGNIQMMRYLVLRGANLNLQDPTGATALHMAAYKKNYTAVNFLIENGARIDIIDNASRQPLEYLPEEQAIAILMNRLHTQSERDQALLDFATNNSYMGVYAALSKGGNVNVQDSSGNTPLMLALRNTPDPRIIQMLLAHGANPLLQNNSHSIALDYAMLASNPEVLLFVESYTTKYELDNNVSRPKRKRVATAMR